MQMVILAGGLGTRLGEPTATTPKAMVPVLGRPFLEHQIALLRQHGVTRIVLCIGHHGEQIQDYFGTGERFGVSLQYSSDGDRLLGTGGALKQAEPLLDERFLLMWGDSYLLLDYQDIARAFCACDLPAMMVVYRNCGQGEKSNVVIADGRVAVYDKWQSRPEMVWVDEGLTALTRGVLARVPPGQPFAIEEVFRQLAGEGKLAAYETTQRFYEIGSPSGLQELEALLADSARQ